MREECVEEDGKKPKDQVAATLVKTVANSITDMLRYEEEVGSMHPDKKLPTLDLRLWTEMADDQVKIRHTFYKKPMASKATLRSDTAYPESQVKAIMVQEVLRRLRNCSPDCTWEERGEHLTEFARSLRASGHGEKFRREVFGKAVKRFKRELRDHQAGRRDLYRTREERIKVREENGGKSTSDSWFKEAKTKGGKPVTSVFKIPYTGGRLKESVQEALDDWNRPKGIRVKVQEGGGVKLKDELVRQDPFPRLSCGRDKCPLGQECKEKCYQDHVNYKMECVECERNRTTRGGIKYEYYGESSRGCYERYEGHIEAYRGGEGTEKGFMWNHAKEVHEGRKDLSFKMVRLSTSKDPMRRVLEESVRINQVKRERQVCLMNTKSEYFGLQVVRPNYGVD